MSIGRGIAMGACAIGAAYLIGHHDWWGTTWMTVLAWIFSGMKEGNGN